MKFVFGRHFTLSPLFNETLHFVKLCIFPRLEPFEVMRDKSVVNAMNFKYEEDQYRCRLFRGDHERLPSRHVSL
jgi:hypothetical protein